MEGFCEHGDEPRGPYKSMRVIKQPDDCCFFKEGPVRLSQVLTGISRSDEYSGHVKGRRELWAWTCVYGS